ncbi:MAG: hypothetical protein ACREDY_13150, partial [Bradyrhizobium sp.]
TTPTLPSISWVTVVMSIPRFVKNGRAPECGHVVFADRRFLVAAGPVWLPAVGCAPDIGA